MRSKSSSDDEREAVVLDLPTTAADVAAQRHARELAGRGFTLERVDLLEPPGWLPLPRRRKTSEGWQPFEL